jgi:Kef-type K+ transport system membrane component KefB
MASLPLLLVQLLSIIVVGRVFARLLRPLGQPAVIAEILAGISLGPSVLGALLPQATEVLFPAAGMPGLALVSQLALVLFMFLVGLEFDPRLLRGRVRTSLFISQASIALPFALGAALAVPLHASLAPPGVPMLSFALFLGAAMSITAFPVLARILTERGMIRTELGAVSLACAAVDDVTAWCLLAFVVAVAEASGVQGALVTTGLTAGYVGLLVWVVRPLLAPLGPRAGSDLSPDLLAGVFVVLFASAFTTEWIGIHALFGAFLFGAVMPREGGLVHAIGSKLEDVVTVVLLPLFFAYSGLRTHIGLLDDAWSWGVCGAIVAVAVAGKFGGGALAARFTGSTWREAGVIGVLMNTRGLMELVVLNIGLDIGVISDRVFAMMVVMALVTTWMTTPLLSRLWPQAWVDREVAALPGPTLTPAALLCVSDPAIARALVVVGEALVRGTSEELLALHVTPVDRPSSYLREGETAQHGPLAALGTEARLRGVALHLLAFAAADPIAEIARVAAVKRAPLLLVGAQRSTLGGPVSGAVGQLLDSVSQVVVVVEDRQLSMLRRVVWVDADGPDRVASQAFAERLATGAGVPLATGEVQDGDLVVAPCHLATTGLPAFERAAAVAIVRGAR